MKQRSNRATKGGWRAALLVLGALSCGIDDRNVSVGTQTTTGGVRPGGADSGAGQDPGQTPQPGTCSPRDCRSPFDNDCDGQPDDTLDDVCRCVPGSTMACQVPPEGAVGICRAGVSECVLAADGGRSDWSSCTGAQAAQARDCGSGLDNDCNGRADDTECDCVPGDTRSCGASPGSLGCSLGTETCVAGASGRPEWGPCAYAPEPDGTPCNDESAGTIGDACVAGGCQGLRGDLLAVGESFSCAVTRAGGLSCWGTLTPGLAEGPRIIAEAGFVGVSAGGTTACGLRQNGTVACFLDNQFGERGNGAPSEVTDFTALTDVVELDGVVQISTGFRNTVAVDSAGLAWVWGEAEPLGSSELYGPVLPIIVESPVASFRTVPQPHRVRSLGNVASIATGTFHACALRLDGSVACWGNSVFGQLGVPGVAASAEPLDVSGLQAVTQLSSSFGTCAVEVGGSVSCWGISCPGGVFDAFCEEPTPVPGISDAIQVVTSNASCVLERSGQVICWGGNAQGQLGDGTTVDRSAPRPVAGLSDAVLLAAGGRAGHHCALRRGGEVVCWGGNDQGQLGDGTTTQRLAPVPVSGLPPVGLP